jgi:Flp pilus assembly protein TadD
MQDDDAAALRAYDRLITMAPTDARAWCDRGITRSRLGDHAGAIADLSEAIRLDERQVNAYAARSYAHAAIGDRGQACGDALRAKALGDTEMGPQVLSYCD